MKKVSKVKSVQGIGTYTPDNGSLLYKFEYEFEDGMVLSALHKTQEPRFKAGDDAQYTVNGSNPKGSWGKVEKVGYEAKNTNATNGFDPATTERIERSWAMRTAVLSIGAITRPVTPESMNVYLREVCRLSNVLLKARDTFPRFEHEDLVESYWASQMANDDDLPF